MDSVKDAVPDALRINGHNPFTLLHSALSEGLHDASDEYCLRLANAIRLVMVEFAERLAEVMKDQKELNDALNRLLNRTS
ncbi:hypothetical protein ElP_30240 [Tautonia plasticadhaerens]|uniref:Uncharacterized protein n=2 Tax=Tautonia plasticadhaerens TaxID=2527974 RepID=A0A518H2Q0_9BACT|nr:hypothetical protein ElP_30240 [Tautonia plasticadhaerens]